MTSTAPACGRRSTARDAGGRVPAPSGLAHRLRLVLTVLAIALGATAPLAAQNRVFYAGDGARERFHDVHRLSDGSVLIAGQARSLDWLPPSVPRTQLAVTGLDSSATGQVAFLLHLSADLGTPLRVVHFPPGTARDVFRIRSTGLPGAATGQIYVSGSRDGANVDGYYLARLDGNFVDAPPTATVFVHNVRASGDHKERQPWDVGGDGAVVHAVGRGFDTQWAAIEKIDASGARAVVEHWHAHWHDGGEWTGTPASSYPNGTAQPLRYSALVMKANRRGSLRSTSAADHAALGSDGNGNPGRRGRFPDDYYHAGPCALSGTGTCPNTMPGYTGYRAVAARTQRVGAIAVDRRDNAIYFGYATQSVLPGGNPDFEPAIVAMGADGALRWWDRLYRETAANSPPDQYVDGLAIDYANDRLVVLARSHGNAVDNLWRGNAIALNPGGGGFQNQFTGTNGNIHISWLGSFGLADGRVRNASYVAEYVEGNTNYGAPHPDPLLGGWPNPNAGWPNVNTTRCGADAGFGGGLAVGPDGAVAVACKGRRTITTIDAHQTMPRPNQPNPPVGAWNHFVRVYAPDLSGLRYSSLLSGAWDQATGAGGDNTRVVGLAFAPDGLLAVGWHAADAQGVALGAPVPVADVPAWGRSQPNGESALLARLRGERLGRGDALFADGFEVGGQHAP